MRRSLELLRERTGSDNLDHVQRLGNGQYLGPLV
jgi:hypothetical protein